MRSFFRRRILVIVEGSKMKWIVKPVADGEGEGNWSVPQLGGRRRVRSEMVVREKGRC